ncbi:DNA excision repair protein ERCC-8 [Homalodisca vitripennis]|nr:DNA excision repair protein ERCC-8 [Homalodisca vitripennis]
MCIKEYDDTNAIKCSGMCGALAHPSCIKVKGKMNLRLNKEWRCKDCGNKASTTGSVASASSEAQLSPLSRNQSELFWSLDVGSEMVNKTISLLENLKPFCSEFALPSCLIYSYIKSTVLQEKLFEVVLTKLLIMSLIDYVLGREVGRNSFQQVKQQLLLKHCREFSLYNNIDFEMSHSSAVNCLDVDITGRYILSGAKNGAILVHDLYNFNGHTSYRCKTVSTIGAEHSGSIPNKSIETVQWYPFDTDIMINQPWLIKSLL